MKPRLTAIQKEALDFLTKLNEDYYKDRPVLHVLSPWSVEFNKDSITFKLDKPKLRVV
jgi:hypothetical protein